MPRWIRTGIHGEPEAAKATPPMGDVMERGSKGREDIVRILTSMKVGPIDVSMDRDTAERILDNLGDYVTAEAHAGARRAIPEIERRVRDSASATVKPLVVTSVVGSVVAAFLMFFAMGIKPR